MNIAFYAPLKPPISPVPSGDRLIARMLMLALEGGGHQVFLASRFRSFDASGDARRQQRLEQVGGQLAARLLRRFHEGRERRPDLWFTYHLYHKAPDWIGPHIARALKIPYVVAEASFAPKQKGGRWARGHESVARTLGAADLVIALNRSDMPCLRSRLAGSERLIQLKPFLDCAPWRKAAEQHSQYRKELDAAHEITPGATLLLSVAMMREGGKLCSYRLLARALEKLGTSPWHLLIAGDGPKANEVLSLFAPFQGRFTWLGECDTTQLARLYGACDIFVWPAIREAIGMSFLEAQAAGVPVVGSDGGGVPDVVANGKSGLLAVYGDEDDFVIRLGALLDDPPKRKMMGEYAAGYALREHDLGVASRRLCAVLEELVS